MEPSRPTDAPTRGSPSRPGRTVTPSSNTTTTNDDVNNDSQSTARLLGLFRRFDTNRTGILQLEQIQAMVKAIMLPTDTTKKKQTNNIASIILQSLDKDKSGGVDRDEFVAWVTKGAELKPEQRKVFGSSGPVQSAILEFLESVERCLLHKKKKPNSSSDQVSSFYTQDTAIDEVVNDLFEQFDVDNDGHIERDELCAMLMEVCLSGGMSTGYEATYEAAEKVLDILDTDKSGSIEPEELTAWVREGLTLSPEQRRSFSKNSVEKTCLIRFLASMEECIEDKLRENNGGSSNNSSGGGAGSLMGPNKDIPGHIWNAVSTIFKRYDEDGSGAIDGEELGLMILHLNEENETLAKSTEYSDTNVLKRATTYVMQTLCGNDDDVLLSLNAFASWVAEGMKLTPTERKIFARSGPNKAVLIRFLRTVEDEIIMPNDAGVDGNGSASEGGGGGSNGISTGSYESQLKRSIQDVFNQYDSDGSGAIDLEELSAMITEVQIEEGVPSNLIKHQESKLAAQSVMKILVPKNAKNPNAAEDNSNELLITLPTFRDWLLKGIKMTALQRKAFAKVNTSNTILARFLRAVERLARQYTGTYFLYLIVFL